MMASGKNVRKKPSWKLARGRGKTPTITRRHGLPWLTISAVAVMLALASGIGFAVFSKSAANKAASDAVARYVPSADNKDPSTKIAGVYADTEKYTSALHVQSAQRVDYDIYPPVGGPHDGYWADCSGVVYTKPVRDENMVHTLEHGALWIAYNPDTIEAGDLDLLKGLVQGKQFRLMSPYPTLKDHPISLQAWGHRLQVDSASDPRVQQFITAAGRNAYIYPEVGATCEQPSFPTADPPPFDASPRGAGAVPLDGGTLAPNTSGMPGAAGSGTTAAALPDESAPGSAFDSARTGSADSGGTATRSAGGG